MRPAILGLTVLVAASAPAFADDKAKAKKLYDKGLQHYNLAEYPEAIKAWKEAYSLSKKPLLLFNIGQAYRLSGDCKLAMTFYDNYQREEPNPKNQDELDSALNLCAKQPDKQPDKKPVVVTPKPPDKPVITAPVADKPKETAQPETDPDGGEEPVDGPTTTGGGLRKVGYGVAGLGVVLGAAGVYFALDASSKAGEVDGFTGEWTQEQIDIEAAGKSSSTKALIFGVGGIAAIAAGGVLIAIGGPKTVESSGMSFVPTRGGAAVGWSMRW